MPHDRSTVFELALPSYKAPASAPLGNNNGSTILPPPTNTQAPIAVNISQALVHEDVNILAQKPTNKVGTSSPFHPYSSHLIGVG